MSRTIHAIAATEVEKHVIGAILLDNSVAPSIVAMLRPEDFFESKHTVLFSAMRAMVMRKQGIDIITLREQLESQGDLKRAGGPDYILTISQEVFSSINSMEHANIVKEKSVRRAMRVAHMQAIAEIEKGETPLPEQIERTRKNMDNAVARGRSLHGIKLVKRDAWVQQALQSYNTAEYRGLAIGMGDLDRILRVAPGLMTVVTGVPNHGKSEVVDAIAVNMARNHDWRTAFFSPENNPMYRHVQKLTEKVAGASTYGASRMSFERFQHEVEGFVASHFEFLDQGLLGATFEQVLDEIQRIRPVVQMAVVDPWNRLVEERKDKETETDYIRRQLSLGVRFAQQTGINLNIVAHPQKMRRDPKTQQILKPNLYDISGSAHWFNITDNGIMVWRDFAAKCTEVHVQKVRFKAHGEVGVAKFGYDSPSGRYIPWSIEEADRISQQANAERQRLPGGTGKDFIGNAEVK